MSRKTVLVTGASRGIGKAIAIKFARKGYNVVISCIRNEDRLIQTKKEIENYQVPCLAYMGDMGDMDCCKELFAKIKKQFGGIDVLVNNAGISVSGLFMYITPEQEELIWKVNVQGTYNCTRSALPFMINAKSGKIINISSMWGQTGASCEVHYSASKAAIIGFTKALAKELGPSGINVNCIAPGVILTDMNNSYSEETMESLKNEAPLERLGKPEDIAESISFLASEKSSFITGQILGVNGGLII